VGRHYRYRVVCVQAYGGYCAAGNRWWNRVFALSSTLRKGNASRYLCGGVSFTLQQQKIHPWLALTMWACSNLQKVFHCLDGRKDNDPGSGHANALKGFGVQFLHV
jgi:hypothetical protein